MHRIPFSFSVLALAGYAMAAAAQTPTAQGGGIKLSDVAGKWKGKTMVGPKDSVVATYTLTATADDKGWTLKFPHRKPVPTRVVAVGGDSIVTESGPYESVLRPGQMVTTRTTGHVKGDKMTGTFEAHYASGDVLRGKIKAKRK